MNNWRLDIKRGLETLAEAQRHREFQRLGVQLAKRLWPELQATEEQRDGGEDATSFVCGSDGLCRSLSVSLTGTLAKIRQDAKRINERGVAIDCLVFITSAAIDNLIASDWSRAIKAEFGHGVQIIPQTEVITLLEQPENRWLCNEYLGLAIENAETISQKTQTFSTSVTNAPPSPNPFIGRERDIVKLWNMLGDRSSCEKQAVALFGKIGVGKSTFLAHLAWEEKIRRKFRDGVYWAALGQNEIAVPSMLREWCRLADVDSAGLLPPNMAARLGEKFIGRQILLLVDDVWRASDLGEVQRLLHPTVQLVFTSRLPGVAHEVSPASTYSLETLEGSAGVELLRYFAGEAVDAHPEKCLELVHALDGLPLALHVAGRLLATRQRLGLGVETLIESLRDGAIILEKNLPPNMQPFIEEANKNSTVAELVRRSVDYLPPQARRCFFCLGAMAPKPATFNLEAIRDVWFFVTDPLPVLSVLVDSGFLEPLSNNRFQMHAMLVAYAKWRLEGVEKLEDL